MTTIEIVSIVITVVASVAAIIASIYSGLQHRFVKRLQTNVRRPHTIAPIMFEENKSVRIFPQNIGGDVATNFKVVVRYPNGAKITDIDQSSFMILEGGKDNYFVTLQKGRVYPGESIRPIRVVAEEHNKEIQPDEVLSWSSEEMGIIALPQELKK